MRLFGVPKSLMTNDLHDLHDLHDHHQIIFCEKVAHFFEKVQISQTYLLFLQTVSVNT
jgi:hypothetical protein